MERHESKRSTAYGRANSMTGMPNLAVTPPAIAQRQSADWGLVQPEQVEVIMSLRGPGIC